MNIFFLSLLIGALAIPMEKVPGTKPIDVLMSQDKGIADAEVPMAKAKAPIAKAHEPKPNLSHLSMLEKFKHDPKYFVSQMSKADPRTLRTILGLLNDMLTTSDDRESHLHGNWDTAQDELDVANADVIAAEGVLSGAEQDQTDADTTLATANADLIAKRAVQTDAQTEKDDAQTSYDDAIGSLDDEQEVLQKVISILSELLGKQPETENYKVDGCQGRMFGGHIGIDLPDARGYHLARWGQYGAVGDMFIFAGIEQPYLKLVGFRADDGSYVNGKYLAFDGTPWSYDQITPDVVMEVWATGHNNGCQNGAGYCMREITGCPRSFNEQ